jgi:hypothetical protein
MKSTLESRTCRTCRRCEVGEVEIDGTAHTVGYCFKYGCFMSENELDDDESDEGCWEAI